MRYAASSNVAMRAPGPYLQAYKYGIAKNIIEAQEQVKLRARYRPKSNIAKPKEKQNKK